MQFSRGGSGRQVAWSFGYYADTQKADVGDQTRSPARLAGRVTWVPPWLEDPGRARLVHTNAALEYVASPSFVQYTARPESTLAPILLDTGKVDASRSATHGVELGIRQGPLVVQAEYLGAVVSGGRAGSPLLWGGYVALGQMLTGEVRPYDERSGTFGMPEPVTPVSIGQRRWRGAWEVAPARRVASHQAGRAMPVPNSATLSASLKPWVHEAPSSK